MTGGVPPESSSSSSEEGQRRREAERLYDRARALDPEARAEFLDDACRDDPRLREELLSLLEQADGAEAFFERLTNAVFASPDSIVRAVIGGAGGRREAPSSLISDLPAGHTVRHYRILGRIGAGGMGTVYRARDTRLNRDVALKFLPAYLSASDDAEERLLVEARAAAGLDHANVCTVHEIGETDDGRPFIAMALYGGETLKARLRRGPFPPKEAVEIAIQIARGLAAAHEMGIVHRDLKPGNVILTTDGTAKLLDFGLAKVAEATLTQPGATPGTVAYMSPEQARGDPLDRRTDLWSLGVVLYEMLAGLRPFRGGNDRAVIQAILYEEPESLGKRRPGTPESMQRIVDRLLRKDPKARYGDARDVVADLERALRSGAGGSRAPAVRRRIARLAGVATALAALVGAALWLNGRGEEPAPGAAANRAGKPSIAVLPLANLSADPRDAALADGMTQELIAMLAKAGGLRVIASTSAFAFRDRQIDVRRIADSLGVANVVEGSLQKIGDRLRIQVRLVDVSDGSTRWSETYDREFRDVFSIQEDIARAVAVELDARLAGDPDRRLQRHRTSSVAAYEFYLRGSDDTLRRTERGLRQGVEYLEQAIAADSMFAAPYAALARLYMNLSNRPDPGMPVGELHELAEQAALKAIALDDSLAEGHASLGFIRWFVTHDLEAAEAELRRAVAVDPTHSLSHAWLAQLYLRTGRPAEALAEARLALENDPLSPIANAEVAHALLANGRYDEALARLGSVAQLQPPLYRANGYLAQAYGMKGMWKEAIEALRPRLGDDGGTNAHALYGYLLARSGRREAALQIRETTLDRVRNGTRGAFDMVVVEAGLGDLDQAFAWLDRAIEDRSTEDPTFHIMQPIFEELRMDPRFEPLEPRLGIQNR